VYTLIVLNKDGQVHASVPLQQGELLIGRSRTNAVVLPSTSVSRQHARVYTAQGRVFIQDLRSSNGILVDGNRIAETSEIDARSQIRIGEFILVLQQTAPSQAAPYGAPAPQHTPPPQQAPQPTYRAPQAPTGPPPPTGGHAVMPSPQPPAAPPLPPAPQRQAGPRAGSGGASGAGAAFGYARLVGINGTFEGDEYLLSERENTIGRTEDNFILLPDPSVSRNHARIVLDESGSYVIYDLRSSNGTAVNSKRVSEATLRDGDLVSLGNVAFRFVSSRSGSSSGARARRKGGSKALIVVLGIFLGVMLLGGIIVGVIALQRYHRYKVAQEQRAQVEQAIAKAREHIGDKEWAEAVREVDVALEIDAADPVLSRLKEKIGAEQKAKESLDAASSLEDEDRLEEAVKALEEIPKRSVYHKEAGERIGKLKARIDQQIKKDGLAACAARKWMRCHELLATYLDRHPKDDEAYQRIRYSESRLRRKRKKFTKWQPPQD